MSLLLLTLLALAAALPPSAGWLARLPDGETKRKFILDCTGCHPFDEKIALVDGRSRTEAEWAEAVTRMLGYAGARTSFPVIAWDREAKSTAAWLARHSQKSPSEVVFPVAAQAEITEFMMPEPGDLPHDLAIERSGSVLVTGMFTHVLYRLDPSLGRFTSIPIPVEKANPRAIDIDSLGRVWLVLGAPNKLAVMERDSVWRSFDVGMYPHSLAIGSGGRVWFNGHFTYSPELIGHVEAASGRVATHEVPAHPTLGKGPGGPIPYELRVGPDGRVWGSELAGNRIFAFTPGNRRFEVFSLPTPHSGPRRFDVDSKGIVWIPAYAANLLVRFDPASGIFSEIPLPVRDAVPYIVRADRQSGALWIGTGAADALFRYDPATRQFETYRLPSQGALVRHLAIDSRNGTVWAAYGASPGIPARIARVQRR
ncbi:MAG TPA: hypothetical protein VF252_12055 [Gemmatimonadales bacterium]